MNCQTAIHYNSAVPLSIEEVEISNAETALDTQNKTYCAPDFPERPIEKPERQSARVGWSSKYSNGISNIDWNISGTRCMKITIDDSDFNNISVFYKGPTGVDIAITRSSIDNVGTVFEVRETLTLRDEDGEISVPLPEGMDTKALTGLVEAVKQARAAGVDEVVALQRSPWWLKWIAAGADAATIIAFVLRAAGLQ
jgi:hypothetical protein